MTASTTLCCDIDDTDAAPHTDDDDCVATRVLVGAYAAKTFLVTNACNSLCNAALGPVRC